MGSKEVKLKVKALNVKIDVIFHQHNLTTLSNKYGRSGLNKYGRLETVFQVGQNMLLFPVKNKTKIDQINKKIRKAVLRQKSLL